MSINQEKTMPLDWNNEFQMLLKHIDVEIKNNMNIKKETLIRYQTAIAIGGYLGPTPKELLLFTWKDVIGIGGDPKYYEFKKEKRNKVVIHDELKRLVRLNYERLVSARMNEFIIQNDKKDSISLTAFNKKFKKLLSNSKIDTPNPSCYTLRKTHAKHTYEKYKASVDVEGLLGINPIQLTSKHMNHNSIEYTINYLGLDHK